MLLRLSYFLLMYFSLFISFKLVLALNSKCDYKKKTEHDIVYLQFFKIILNVK